MTGITEPRQEYKDNIKSVMRNRAAANGQRAIKAGRMEYLRPLNSQLNTLGELTADGKLSYESYLNLALYLNAVGRTVDGTTGLVFRKPPVVELPANIEYLRENIDSVNCPMIGQMQETTRDAFVTPRCGLLVDFPTSAAPRSVADAEKSGHRPTIKFYPYESIINSREEMVDGQLKLTMVVLVEAFEKVTDKFKSEVVKNYRLLELIGGVYHGSLYDDSGNVKVEAKPVKINGKNVTSIPFYNIQPLDGVRSPVDDLVDVNLNHYNMFAAYANKEHMSGFPIYWETGVQGGEDDEDKNVSIGPGSKWTSSNPEAQFGILETSGDGGSLKTYLDDRKSEMAALGADMFKESSNQAESGEAKRIDKVAQNATAADVAQTVGRAYKMAFELCAEWAGGSGEVKLVFNTDYTPKGVDAQMLSAMLMALQSGDLSYESFYEYLQAGELVGDRAIEDERALLESKESDME